MAVSPSDVNRIVYANKFSLFLSTDGLETSTVVIDNIQEDNVFDDIKFAPSNTDIVYAVTKGYLFYKSTDGGLNWTIAKNIRDEVLDVIP